MFLSKGLLVKKESKNSVIIRKHGSRYILNGEKARIWLLAKDQFFIPNHTGEMDFVSQLCKEGLMAQADKRNEYGKYYVLATNCLCVNTRKKGRFFVRGNEKRILEWFQDGRRRLRMEELVFLIEHNVPISDYETDEFGVALSERIYRSRVQVDNTLRREMSYAKSRDEVVNAVLRLLGKNRLYLS